MDKKGLSSVIALVIGALIILGIAVVLIMSTDNALGNISNLLVHKIRGV